VHFDDEKNEACHDLLVSLFFSITVEPGKLAVQPSGWRRKKH